MSNCIIVDKWTVAKFQCMSRDMILVKYYLLGIINYEQRSKFSYMIYCKINLNRKETSKANTFRDKVEIERERDGVGMGMESRNRWWACVRVQ